jgi:hypothetical protein
MTNVFDAKTSQFIRVFIARHAQSISFAWPACFRLHGIARYIDCAERGERLPFKLCGGSKPYMG